jgi:hypothetical protein
MKRFTIPAATLTLAVALAGCGGGGGGTVAPAGSATSGSTASSVSASPSATSTGSSASAASPAAGSTGAAPELATRMAAAVGAAKSGKSVMTIQGTDKSGKATKMTSTGEFVVAGSGVNIRSVMDTGSGALEFSIVDGVTYMKNPSAKPTDKPWVKIDPNGKDLMSVMFGAIVQSMGNPAQLVLKGWEGATVTPVGTDGVLKQYQVTGLKGGDGMDVRVWVDGQDRPAKMTMTKAATSGASSADSIVVTFSDWGAAITISAPPADQIGTMPTS